MPLVSIVLTSYNHEKYIRESIASILNQTFHDFELIIWDDASQDSSWKIIQEYQDPRIRAFQNRESKRGIFAINQSISKIAKGRYIAIHHSDDVWEATKLERQLQAFEVHPEMGAVFTWAEVIDEHGAVCNNPWFQVTNKSQAEWLRELFVGENHLCHPSVLVRKSVYDEIGLYRTGLIQTGDAEMWSRILIKYPIFVIPENLTQHRRFLDGSNASGNVIEKSIRTENEWNALRLNYFNNLDSDAVIKIFPSLKNYKCDSLSPIPNFLLALACIEECISRAAWALGVSQILELMRDEETVAKLNALYGFGVPQLISITGEADPYALMAGEVYETVISKRDAQIEGLGQSLSARDQQIANLNELLGNQGELINRANQSIDERDAQIEGLGQSLSARDQQIANLNELLGNQGELINRANQSIDERDAQIEGLGQSLSARDQQIANLNELLGNQGELINRANQSIDERDAQIEGLGQSLSARDQQIANLNELLGNQGELINRANQSIDERDAQIEALRIELTAIMQTRSWRFTVGLRKLNKLLGIYRGKIKSLTFSRLMQSAYKALPFNAQVKVRLRDFGYEYFPVFFKGMKGYPHWKFYRSLSVEGVQELNTYVTQTLDKRRGDFSGAKILVIDASTPTPDRDAGSVTTWFYLKAFVDLGLEVTFIPEDLKYLGKYSEDIKSLGIEYLSGNDISSIHNFLELFGAKYDYVLLYRVHTARLALPNIKKYAPQAKIIFDTVDLHYLREERKAELSGDRYDLETAAYTKIVEYETMALSDATIVLSEAEREIILREKADLNICTIPLLLDIPGSDVLFDERQHIVFIGGFLHQPNIDAVKYFTSEIWPNVKKHLPECEFQIIGANMPEEIIQMADSDQRIKAIGYVEDLGFYFNRCKVSIAPLRYGAGIKGKIGTSASYGVPTVATSLAAEGMGLENRINVLIADDPHQFAKDLIELYLNKDLWGRLSKNSQKFVEDNFSYELGRQKLASLLSDLGSR